jgi:hypothetical protein
MREFVYQEFDSVSGDLSGLTTNNNSINQDANNSAKAGVITLPVNPDLSTRNIFAYIWARVASDALSFFEFRVALLFEGKVEINLPLLYSYKTSGVSNGYRLSAFTYSDAATPIIVPGSITLKLQSNFGQPQNPPSDETTGLVYLHPYPVEYPISQIRVDAVRWTNVNPGSGNFRVVIVSKAQ